MNVHVIQMYCFPGIEGVRNLLCMYTLVKNREVLFQTDEAFCLPITFLWFEYIIKKRF